MSLSGGRCLSPCLDRSSSLQWLRRLVRLASGQNNCAECFCGYLREIGVGANTVCLNIYIYIYAQWPPQALHFGINLLRISTDSKNNNHQHH